MKTRLIRSVSLAKSFPNDDDEHKTKQAADQLQIWMREGRKYRLSRR